MERLEPRTLLSGGQPLPPGNPGDNNGAVAAANGYATVAGANNAAVDNQAPLLTSLSPTDNATGVPLNASLVLSFTERIQAGPAGNIVIKQANDGSIVESIPVSGSEVTVSGSTATVVLVTPLPANTTCYVLVDAGTFQDAAGNAFAGISAPTTWSFTTGETSVAGSLQATYGPNGLATLSYAGRTVLDLSNGWGGGPGLDRALAETSAGSQYYYGTSLQTTQMSSSGSQPPTLTLTYAWGTIQQQYIQNGNDLTLSITVTNGLADGILEGVDYYPLTLRFPDDAVINQQSVITYQFNTDGPSVACVDYGEGMVAVTNDDVSTPLITGFTTQSGPGQSYSMVLFSTPPWFQNPNWPIINQPLNPGMSATYSLTLRFGPSGSSLYDLAADVYNKYAALNPQQISWPDNRPIGQIFLSQNQWDSSTNPQGYLSSSADYYDPSTNTYNTSAFGQDMATFAGQCVQEARLMNAQGVIVWDLEGAEFSQPTAYLGDPTQLAAVAPEMNAVADEFFQQLTDAGLRVGLCIRPQDLTLTTSSDGEVTGASQADVPPDEVLTLLENKIQYAIDRWGASLFYIDSDVYGASAINTLGLTTGGGYPVYIFQQLHERFPNVLIIPEQHGVGEYAYTAGYVQLAPTAADVRSTYPDALSFDAELGSLTPAQLQQQSLSPWVQAVQAGDILSYLGWYDSAGNQFVREVYSQAFPAPTVSAAQIEVSGATGTGGVFRIGDVATATWNNSAGGDDHPDLITAVTVDFSQFGGGSAVAAADHAGIWTAQYPITAGTITADDLNVSVTATGVGGSTTTAGTNNVALDNQPPTIREDAPAENVTGVPVATDLALTFNQSVQPGPAGDVVIRKTADNSIVESIPVTSSAVAISGSTATIAPPTPLAPGTSYYVQVDAGAFQDQTGNAFAGISGATAWTFTTAFATVAGRYLFYSNSYYDGYSSTASSADDEAIDTSKQALLPGQTATYANYTDSTQGINGIMVDIAGLANPAGLTSADFQFLVGNDSTPGDWTALAIAPTVTVRVGAGTGGSARVELTWPDNTIHNQWLQVIVLADANTGLAANDVFYFGSEPGGVLGAGYASFDDVFAIYRAIGSTRNVTPEAAFDVNHDGMVTFDDIFAVYRAIGGAQLNMITVPAASATTSMAAMAATVTAAAAVTAADTAGSTAAMAPTAALAAIPAVPPDTASPPDNADQPAAAVAIASVLPVATPAAAAETPVPAAVVPAVVPSGPSGPSTVLSAVIVDTGATGSVAGPDVPAATAPASSAPVVAVTASSTSLASAAAAPVAPAAPGATPAAPAAMSGTAGVFPLPNLWACDLALAHTSFWLGDPGDNLLLDEGL